MSFLIIERGKKLGKRISIKEFPATVGRDAENTIQIDDDEISRYHLRIKKRGRIYVVEDLQSKNGTFINGDKVLNSIVKNGDKILIGTTELLFVAATSGIEVVSNLEDFNMILANDLGLEGPIHIKKGQRKSFAPTRISPQTRINLGKVSFKDLKNIYEVQGNVFVVNDLEECTKTFLKYLGKIIDNAARAAFFVWNDTTKQLVPTATNQYIKGETPFNLSQRSFEDVISRKQGLMLQSDSAFVTQSGTNRVILPVVHNDSLLGVLHIESKHPAKPFLKHEISMMQSIVQRCAPGFESLLLRKDIDGWLVGIVETLIATIEAKDTYTRGHSERVSKYSMAIADELKLNRETKKSLLVSSLCHDIGKIGIPDSILKKAGILSADEYEEIKLHPSIGAEIMASLPNAQKIMSGVKHHHEKWDGTGYPDALAGEEIPFFGRIVAIADVFDAMVSGRSYSGFLDQSEAVERLSAETDLFDPEIFKAFVRAYENGSLSQKTSTKNNNPSEDLEKEETKLHRRTGNKAS